MRAAFEHLSAGFGKIEGTLGSEPAAILWMIMSGSTYFVMLCYTKLNAGKINSIQIQLYRGVLCFIFLYLITSINKISRRVDDRRVFKLLILRNFLACLHNVYQFVALRYVRISLIATVNMTGPIIICFLDSLFYKTKYTLQDKVLTGTNIFGVMLVANPTMFTNMFSSSSDFDSQQSTSLFELMMVCIQLCFVSIWAYAMIIVKELRGLNTMIVAMPFGIILALASSAFLLSEGDITDISFGTGIEIVVYIGIAGFLCQIASMRGMQIGKTGKASIFINTPVLWGFLFEIFYYGENPNVVSLIGSVIVAVSSVMLTLSKTKK